MPSFLLSSCFFIPYPPFFLPFPPLYFTYKSSHTSEDPLHPLEVSLRLQGGPASIWAIGFCHKVFDPPTGVRMCLCARALAEEGLMHALTEWLEMVQTGVSMQG